jgi:hypothetical protein
MHKAECDLPILVSSRTLCVFITTFDSRKDSIILNPVDSGEDEKAKRALARVLSCMVIEKT